MKRVVDIWNRLKSVRLVRLNSRSVLLFLSFVLLSTIMWCVNVGNATRDFDFEVPVSIVGKPDNVHFLTNLPDTITVQVSAKGAALVKYIFSRSHRLELKYSDYVNGEGSFKVDKSKLRRQLSRLFKSMTIKDFTPDYIIAEYTDQPGKRVPVVVDAEIMAGAGYTLTGPTTPYPDSVTVYGETQMLKNITEVYTCHIKESNLTDTMKRNVKIASLKKAVVDPQAVNLIIPVEKMVQNTQKIKISVLNTPPGVRVLLFPSTVTASFLAAPSLVKKISGSISASVDCRYINTSTPGNKVIVSVQSSGVYENVKLDVDSVEYLIEKQK